MPEMLETKFVPVLDADFPVELAFWNKERDKLIEKYPNKYLIIRGEDVEVLDDFDALVAAEAEGLADRPGLVKFTQVGEPEAVYSPFLQVKTDA